MSTTTNTTGLLDLPAEVRLQIYSHLLPRRVRVDSDEVSDKQRDQLLYAGIAPPDRSETRQHFFAPRSQDPPQQAALALMRTCKTLYREVNAEFYRKLRFHTTDRESACLFSIRLPTFTASLVQNLTLTDYIYDSVSKHGFHSDSECFGTVQQLKYFKIMLAKLPNLRVLTINNVPFTRSTQHSSEPTWSQEVLFVLSMIPKMHKHLNRAFYASYQEYYDENEGTDVIGAFDDAGPPVNPDEATWNSDDDDAKDRDYKQRSSDTDFGTYGSKKTNETPNDRRVDINQFSNLMILDDTDINHDDGSDDDDSDDDGSNADDSGDDKSNDSGDDDDSDDYDSDDDVSDDDSDDDASDSESDDSDSDSDDDTNRKPGEPLKEGFTTIVFCADKPRNWAFQEVDFPARWQSLFDAVPPKAESNRIAI